jgi:hypothetical protein
LQENGGVVANDGIYAGGLVAREDDTRQHERNDVAALEERSYVIYGSESNIEFYSQYHHRRHSCPKI